MIPTNATRTIISSLLCIFPLFVLAHGGGLNSQGCHNQTSTSTYHCHSGEFNGLSFDSQTAFLAYVAGLVTNPNNEDTDSDQSDSLTYSRDDYLPFWSDDDGDCINTRHEVLIQESLIRVTMSQDGCTVASGEWYDPISNKTFTDPSDLDIDHHVALAEAHRSGASVWDTSKKRAFANDLLNSGVLQAMDDSTNASKSDKDPANWLPPNESYRCQYVKNWAEVKSLYDLSFDDEERQAIEEILGKPIEFGTRTAVSGLQASSGDSMGRFALGITNGRECGYSESGNLYSNTMIDFSIVPDEKHINEYVDILVVLQIGTDIYSVNDKLELVPFGGEPAQLAAFVSQTSFRNSREFKFIETTFQDSLLVSIYLGYRLNTGDLVYSSAPFRVAIN